MKQTINKVNELISKGYNVYYFIIGEIWYIDTNGVSHTIFLKTA